MSAANSYAKALYEAAQERTSQDLSQTLDTLEKEMDTFEEVLSSSKEVKIALVGPLTTSREKVALVEGICQKLNFSALSIQFFTLLARKTRFDLLKEIRDSFNSIRLTAQGGMAGKLVSAEALSAADVEDLAKAFSKKLGKKIAFRVSTDSSLLAGVKVTVNGVTYDGTLRSQLQKLRDRFTPGATSAQA